MLSWRGASFSTFSSLGLRPSQAPRRAPLPPPLSDPGDRRAPPRQWRPVSIPTTPRPARSREPSRSPLPWRRRPPSCACTRGSAGAEESVRKLMKERERERETMGDGERKGVGRGKTFAVAPRPRSLPIVLTMSVMRPSSGFGCSRRSLMVDRTVGMFRDGFQAPLGGMFKVSKHIRPLESILGW